VISNTSNVGGLIGSGWTSKVFGSSANVEVIVNFPQNDSGLSCASGIGGLAGSSQGTISDCSSNGTVTVINCGNVGGLVGYQASGYVYNSFSTVNVIGTKNNTGGLIGLVGGGEIRETYATGTVQGVNNTGGLIGLSSSSRSISQSYATGNVTGKNATGGLIGLISFTPNITQTYAIGLVIGEIGTGGLIGAQDRFNDTQYVNASYWDVETTNTKDSVAGEGKGTSDMYLQETYQGWDFNTVWGINPGKGYPYLQLTPP